MPEVRLIDANALKPEMEILNTADMYLVCHIIDNAPTIEPEVRHGRWVPHKITASSKCSECRRFFADETLFCPNCGARMDATDTNVGGKMGGADNGN